jgi:hypothetical protein
MPKPKPFHSCQTWRRVKITAYTMDLATGKRTPKGSHWETNRCGVPLFGDDQRAAGQCGQCASGWEVPDNRPATEAEIRAAIEGGAHA